MPIKVTIHVCFKTKVEARILIFRLRNVFYFLDFAISKFENCFFLEAHNLFERGQNIHERASNIRLLLYCPSIVLHMK